MRPRDSELTRGGKAVVIGIVLAAVGSAAGSALRADAPHPGAFAVTLVGLAAFLIAKITVIRTGRLITFGSREMTPAFANLYRLGYWLMAVGILLTFAR